MKISLAKWGARNFDPPPHISTLRAWARQGKIYPPPMKVGRAYYVDENAVHVSEIERGPRLVHRLGLKKI
ncbi:MULTISPECIES: excisionase [Ralstonia solanacearum species complex]|uniref:Excisionase-like domain-containing protein n=2 Tax=Ralstonia solanacearum TaxID=305 RepID=A0ABF7RBK4_RALSL|nr:excisionase [Ralstonia solanacearum]ATI27993.1 excisionase [Ralstonia solanacearum]ATJ87767.1 excisionase [Ralstonia solanacearum]KEI31500.1 excisionase [Ralstonia solanacearum]KFX78043.1 excisionase [Ralstonia solanacearum]KFX81550.1 excisionase [Ralstonia solanacearum]